MAFDPKLISINVRQGSYNSRSIFSTLQGVLSVESNGNPFPANANINGVTLQDYKFSFVDRCGTNTQNPQKVFDNYVGILANGVLIKPYSTESTIPNNNIAMPSGFTINRGHFPSVFTIDPAHGVTEQISTSVNEYTYRDGAFLTNGWSIQRFYNFSNDYYRTTNFNSDFFRHSDGHSKILGFCFDGYPIYGPYGYKTSINQYSGTKLLLSSYRTKIKDTHRPSDWKYDKTLSTTFGTLSFTAGAFVDDYVFYYSNGDLDEYNGRYCVTPEYPKGTYAYFVTFTDDTLSAPAYPYIIGPSTKQKITYVNQPTSASTELSTIWKVPTGSNLGTIVERRPTDILLPLVTSTTVDTEIISGKLPRGLRLNKNRITGTVFEVQHNELSTFVVRAYFNDLFEDRTLEVLVIGPDSPEWQTNAGLLPVNPNKKSVFVLDNEIVDYQLIATDSDIPAGDELEFFIGKHDGELPPGLTLSKDGRIQGIVEPLLSLEKIYQGGGYDTAPYSKYPLNFYVPSSNGFASYYFDSVPYDFSETERQPIKLNRYYPFTVTVTDGDWYVRRDFTIYVVGDDFLTADNTITHAATGIFTADNTNVRTPVWITPRNLGFKRADNYTILVLDIIHNETLDGLPVYTLEDLNDDGSISELPPGLSLDALSGEIAGILPYQPAVTENYKFTIRATRMTQDDEHITVYANFYEDVIAGNTKFKIYKLDLTSDDNFQDLKNLVNQKILLGVHQYTVLSVDDSNSDYDTITLTQPLIAQIDFKLSRTAAAGQDYFFINRITNAQREQVKERVIKFSEYVSYTINSVSPYIEYSITSENDIYPINVPYDLVIGTNYFIGDIVTGENGKIYKCKVDHTYSTFELSNWDEIAETINQLSISQIVSATLLMLKHEFNYDAYINAVTSKNWTVMLPQTAHTTNLTNIKDIFGDLTTIQVLRENEDKVQLNTNIGQQLLIYRNIGLALLKDDYFTKDFVVASQDDVVMPSSVKTFELTVIGEIDSNINWITPSDLGTINSDYVSTLFVKAETTVPDSSIVYTFKSGRLPYGMYMSYSGEIIGIANQTSSPEQPGLTIFDSRSTTFDGGISSDTSFDREFHFVVEARDRFNYSAVEREFKLSVNDFDNTLYTDIYMRPMLAESTRLSYREFISNSSIFTPESIYRPQDKNFGLQLNLDMLVYSGIEVKEIDKFVAAAATNHKRKQYILGEFKNAVAILPGTRDVVYEVIYIDVIDPAVPKIGKTKKHFTINTANNITVDSLQYAAKDDVTGYNLGTELLPVYGRNLTKFLIVSNDQLIIETRNTDVVVNTDMNDFEVIIRDSSTATVVLELGDSEPMRRRPKYANTFKADTTSIKVSNSKDQIRFISSIANMRDNIKAIGKTEREFLPLWMRSPQLEFQELDYQMAIPICYCKPGTSENILRNIKNSDYNPQTINYDIDRYIIKRTKDNSSEQFILFANYQVNV